MEENDKLEFHISVFFSGSFLFCVTDYCVEWSCAHRQTCISPFVRPVLQAPVRGALGVQSFVSASSELKGDEWV